MARTFVMSDNLTARAELVTDPIDALVRVVCVGHGTEIHDHGFDTMEEAEQAAGLHVDSCARCADAECRTPRPHDAGHRCRKPFAAIF